MFAAEEAEKGLVVVKVLGSGEQTTHATADVVTAVAANLSKEEDAQICRMRQLNCLYYCRLMACPIGQYVWNLVCLFV